MLTMHDWQREDVEMAAAHPSKAAFFAWEMGLGKTLAAVEYGKAVGAEVVLVVLPLNTRRSWERTIESQMPGTPVYRLQTDKKHIAAFGYLAARKPGWYLIGWELMRGGAVTGVSVDYCIADETHKQANYGKSLQAIFMREFDAEYKMALSGTPAGNRPEGIFSTMNWLWPDRYKSYYKHFVDKFWRTRRNGAVIDFVRELEPNMIVNDMPVFSRRLVRNHREDMPAVLPEIPIEVELTAGQRHIYNQFAEDSLAWLGDDFVPTSFPLVKEIRLRQVALGVPKVVDNKVTFDLNAKSSKIAALLEVLEANGEDTFLVGVHSTRFIPTVIHQLAKKGIEARAFTGDTKGDERDYLIENLGKTYRVLVASIAAIGEGTDGLQHVCHNMFWMSKHPDAKLNQQFAFRLNRPGQQEPINSWYCYARDTREVEAQERLDELKENMDDMLDHDERSNNE